MERIDCNGKIRYAAWVTSWFFQTQLKVLVVVSILGCSSFSKAATNAVESRSYQEALKMFRATPDYQKAAIELLVGEAKWVAERLGIKEPISGDPSEIGPPEHGINGSVGGLNYSFDFSDGRFEKVRWNDWTRKIDPPVTDMLEFSNRPSQIDSDGALALGRTWLKGLGVDVAALEARSTPSVMHIPGNSARDTPPGQPRPMRPQFIVKWPGPPRMNLPGGRPVPPQLAARLATPLATVEILGTSKQVIELSVAREFWTRPPLELKDASKLLGPDPSPAELMARILTADTYKTIADPEVIEAWLLTSGRNKKDRVGPVKFGPALAKKFSEALLDFDSYNSWSAMKGCVMDEGVRLRIQRGVEEAHVRFCFECDMLMITRAGSERLINFDSGHDRFADLCLEAFPNDAVVRNIPRKPKF
jgi:hypothetical protein